MMRSQRVLQVAMVRQCPGFDGRRRPSIALLTAVLVVAVTRTALAQAPSPADGPWSGQAQCVGTVRAPGYQDEQTHTWKLTGASPITPGAYIRDFPATWSMTGSGSRILPGRLGNTEAWTTQVPTWSAPISIWEPPGSGNIRLASRFPLTVQGAIQGSTAGLNPFSSALQEPPFPVIEVPATQMVIAGSRTEMVPGLVGWRQPSGAEVTETCTWNFTSGGQTSQASPVNPLKRAGAPAATVVPLPPAMATTTVASTTAPAPPPTGLGTRVSSAPVPVRPGVTEVETLTAACTMPAPKVGSPRVTPASVSLSWDPVPGVTGYFVSRQDARSLTSLTPALIQATTFTDIAEFDFNVMYKYAVSAQYSQGCSEATWVSVKPPQPKDPLASSFKATQTADGTVRLEWQAVPGVTAYVLVGPGTNLGLNFTVRGTSQIITGVPAGLQEWRVASMYEPGGILTAGSTWPKATATITTPSGRYRISITGFQAVNETVDLILFDGSRDEIYVAAAKYLDGRFLGIAKSDVHGDVGWPPGVLLPPRANRVKAGTASSTGGIQTGDVVQGPLGTTTQNTFPLLVWEGTLGGLGGSTRVTVKLTIWEWDGDASNYNKWARLMSQPPSPSEMNASPKNIFRSSLSQLALEQSSQADAPKNASTTTASDTKSYGYDRAIGGVSTGTQTFLVTSSGIVDLNTLFDGEINRNAPSGAVPAPVPAPQPNVFIDFTDTGNLGGKYRIFLHFEPIP